MTLLIGTVSKNNIVLTADGLSRANPITGKGMACEDLQKIFPYETSAIAIVHHGLNIINGIPVGQKVASFYKLLADNKPEAYTIKQIAEKLVGFIDNDANATFSNTSNQGGIGFWIAGFGSHQTQPELFEIWWPDKVTPEKWEGLILGGNGKNFLDPYPEQLLRSYPRPVKPNIKRYEAMFAAAYHNGLYATAERLQEASGQIVFGGHKHQLVIKSSGCTWTRSPKL